MAGTKGSRQPERPTGEPGALWLAGPVSDPVSEPTRNAPVFPARRRLFAAAAMWLVVIRTLILIGAGALGLSDLWTTIVSMSVFFALFIPLALAALKELHAARQRGDEPLPQIPTIRSLAGFALLTAALWVVAFWYVLWSGEWIFPLMPILCTIWLGALIRRYYKAGD